MPLSPLLCVACLALTHAPAAPKVRAEKSKTDIAFYAGDQLVTRYVFGGTVQVEKGTGTKPLAKPYFYPLVAPNGVSLTRDWPMKRGTPGETTDHYHQKSAWFCHGALRVTDEEKAAMDEISRCTSKSLSMLVREAIQHYGPFSKVAAKIS